MTAPRIDSALASRRRRSLELDALIAARKREACERCRRRFPLRAMCLRPDVHKSDQRPRAVVDAEVAAARVYCACCAVIVEEGGK